MPMTRKHSGVTLIGFLMILMVVGFFAFLIMRLFPVYSEYYSVASAMKSVQSSPGSANWTPQQIKDSLDRYFNINYVSSVKPANIRITRKEGGYLVNIHYEVRGPLAYNLEYVAVFDKTVDLVRKGVE
jgi:Domain of unknown function (DUF4845)